MLVEKNLKEHCPPHIAQMSKNSFRKNRLYTTPMDELYTEHKDTLSLMFELFSSPLAEGAIPTPVTPSTDPLRAPFRSPPGPLQTPLTIT
eukprot:5648627-Pyramimonas_sp.AAC.1